MNTSQHNQSRNLWLVLLFWVAIGAAPCVRGLEPATALKQAQHTAWGLQDGAPSHIADITQTTDGFLWLASQTGLFSFDGQRFTRHEFPSSPDASWDVTALTSMENNELWVGTRRLGIVRYKDGAVVQVFGVAEGIPRATVYSIRKDSQGQIWAAVSSGVYLLQARSWHRVWPVAGAEAKPAANLWMDRSGSLCFTTDRQVLCKGAGDQGFSSALSGEVEDIALAADGQLWVWLSGVGMRPLQAAESHTGHIASDVAHGHMIFARSGDLFVLTSDHGLMHYAPEAAKMAGAWTRENYGLSDGLQSNYLESLFEDREGNVWVGGTKGLERFRNGKFVAVTSIGASPSTVLLPDAGNRMWAGLRTEPLGFVTSDNQRKPFSPAITGVTAAYQDKDGSSWFGASPFLWHVTNGKASPVQLPAYVQGSSDIQAITRDKQGTLYVSIVRFGVLRLEHEKWTRFDSGSGALSEYATMLYDDDEGRLWMAYHGRVVLSEGASHRTLSVEDGLSFGDVLSFAGRGSVLVAGGEQGIGLYQGIGFKKLPTDRDDLTKNVSGLLFTPDGALWAHGSTALLRISAEDLSAFTSGASAKVKTQVFTFADGLPGLAPPVRPLPSAVLSHDGHIWVSTTSGIAWLDPLHYPRNMTAPTVMLLGVRADSRDYSPAATVGLPALTKSIAFSYTAPSLSIADGTRFRYRLEGFDTDWQEAGNRSTAFYTSLKPGRYRFHLIAANEDMVWNEVGAALEISVAHAFYQTTAFSVTCWAAAAFILWLAYRTRLRLVTDRVRDLLAERLAERERIAGELHDTLIQSVQGLILLFNGIAVQIPSENPLSEKIDMALGRAETLLEEGRDSVRDLRSASFNLADAFRLLEREFQGSTTHYKLSTSEVQPELQLLVCDEVFKLGREAVRNALRHASASTVEVRLNFKPHALEVWIQDDGEGISPDMLRNGRTGHWGLLGMRERARKLRATLEIASGVRQGTQVYLMLPASVAYRNMVPSLRVLMKMYWFQSRVWVREKLNSMRMEDGEKGSGDAS